MASRALRRLMADIDEQHRESMRTIEHDLAEVHFGVADPQRAASRRGFLRRVGAGGAIAFGATVFGVGELVAPALAETGGGGGGGGAAATSGGGDAAVTGDDLAIVVFAQSVELAAAAAYETVVNAGRLSEQEATYASMFARHHSEHAAALGGLAGKEAVDEPNARLLAEFGPRLTGAANGRAQLQVLRDLEEGAVSTYLFALGEFVSYDAAGAASMVLPIEAQHAVALSFLIDPTLEAWSPNIETYVPTVERADGALDPSRYAIA